MTCDGRRTCCVERYRLTNHIKSRRGREAKHATNPGAGAGTGHGQNCGDTRATPNLRIWIDVPGPRSHTLNEHSA
eukprot:7225575-Prymnesium_polylepis.1